MAKVDEKKDTRRAEFVRELAKYLVEDQVRKSIDLQLKRPAALEWQALRSKTPLFGYPTVDEAEAILSRFLLGSD